MSRRERRAAVIGSGFGGLAVAIRLQNAGFQTVIFERDEQPGGRARVFRQDGFVFDAGPTVITAPECLQELFLEAGRKLADYVELLPVTPFYRLVWDDGDRFDYDGDVEHMLAQIRKRRPADAAGYLRFVRYAKQVYDKGYTELAAAPFLRFSDMVRVAPQLARLRADRSVYSTVSRFVRDEHLRQALSFHTLLVGGNPFETSSIYTLIHHLERAGGVWFPRGGTGALVAALVRLFEELGGKLALGTPVERVELLRKGGVQHRLHANGSMQDFDLVVSN
ncbi:MAG TPA: phytoene desaturase family protein, partial [Polyangiales bacterium]|nr:phytoene desaturase family protein [Polyangiales bacterium]